MTGKLNFFTLMIFVYSIVVCSTCKKNFESLGNNSVEVAQVLPLVQNKSSIKKIILKKMPQATSLFSFAN